METRAQNGGGGTSASLRALRDSGQTHGAEPEPREVLVLSLDQIRSVRTSNEYTDGPAVVPRPPVAAQRKAEERVAPPVGPAADDPPEQPQRRSPRLARWPSPAPSPSPREPFSRSVSGGSDGTQSTARASTGSSSSEQRLLGNAGERIVRAQPKRAEGKAAADGLKPLVTVAVTGEGAEREGKHALRCEECGRCKCQECGRPRALPSCWLCGRRCLCSAQTAVDYGTCVCCVKGLFYHCSSDDEDVCADKPFSCSQSRCCVRWSAVGVATLLLPCLLCYLPAKGCLALCQACHGRAGRPGCRCDRANVVRCKSADKLVKGNVHL